MMTGGRPRRWRIVATAIVAFVILLHLIAWSILQTAAGPGIEADRATLIVVTGTALLSWSLMLSQAIEMVTRAFYSRGDLDLVLSSPVSAARVFAVRICAIAATSTFMADPDGRTVHQRARLGRRIALAGRLSGAARDGRLRHGTFDRAHRRPFATLGPKRTRFVAQVVAAIVGATFVIGIQAAAIFSTGTLSRIAALQSPCRCSDGARPRQYVLVAGASDDGRASGPLCDRCDLPLSSSPPPRICSRLASPAMRPPRQASPLCRCGSVGPRAGVPHGKSRPDAAA